LLFVLVFSPPHGKLNGFFDLLIFDFKTLFYFYLLSIQGERSRRYFLSMIEFSRV